MSTQELPEELIILGNGFDLACGLKSSYTDFFNSYLNGDVKVNIKILFGLFCVAKRLELSEIDLAILKDSKTDPESKIKLEEKFKVYEQAASELNEKIFEIKESNTFRDINFFDVYFCINSLREIGCPNWSDVELAIEKLLVDDTVDKESFYVNLKSIRYGLRSNKGNKESLFIIYLLKQLEAPLIVR